MCVIEKYRNMEDFLTIRKNDISPEPYANEKFIESGIDSVKDRIKHGDKILDVGCGHGYAMDVFKELGADPVGITLDAYDKKIAESRGHVVNLMDMSFMEFENEYFDGIWARHCIEHSIFPFYTLYEFNRVLKPLGWLYLEMPSPGSAYNHEFNGNHYSILGGKMWASLITRANFKIIGSFIITFEVPTGTEKYYRFIAEKICFT